MTTDLFQMEVDIAAVALIPQEMAQSQRILAVGFEQGELLVATDDPLNYFALEEVRQITGREIQVLTVEESALSRALAYYYAEAEARKATLDANRDFASFARENQEANDKEDGQTPVIKLLDRLIQRAVSTRARTSMGCSACSICHRSGRWLKYCICSGQSRAMSPQVRPSQLPT